MQHLPAYRFLERVTELQRLGIEEALFLDAEGCRRSLKNLEDFAAELTILSEAELNALETNVAVGFCGHAKNHLTSLLRGEAEDALQLLDEFQQSPSLDSLPRLLEAIKGINLQIDDPITNVRAALALVFAGREEIQNKLALLVGRWLTGGTRRDCPAGSAVLVGPLGSGRSRLVDKFNEVLCAQGLAEDISVEELDLGDYVGPDCDAEDLNERLTELSRQAGRRVIVFDNCESASGEVKDFLKGIVENGISTLIEESVRLSNCFLFFMVRQDPARTLGNSLLRVIPHVIDVPVPGPNEVIDLIAAEAGLFAGDFESNTGIKLTFDRSVYGHLVPFVTERGGFGRAVPAIVEQWLRFPIADMFMQGSMAKAPARVELEGRRLVLVQGSKRTTIGEGVSSESIFDFEAELRKIIGLESVKDVLRAMRNQWIAERRRRDAGVVPRTTPFQHMLFLGNPGTGKTTVARLVARVLRELGVIREGQLVEVSRVDLVGRYLGHTADKTLKVVENAVGGVLFIDEAYSLTRGNDSFGLEAVDTLVREMENRRGELVVILAGYTDEMNEFLRSNSGLRSRFPHHLQFPDYSASDLAEISKLEARALGYEISADAQVALSDIFSQKVVAGRNDQGNGRLARTVIESAISRQAKRIVENPALDSKAMQLLLLDDFDVPEVGIVPAEVKTESVLASLDEIVGLHSIKEFVRDLAAQIMTDQRRRSMGVPTEALGSLHMLFKGNPGTGKTTIARLVGRLLKELNVLKLGHVVEVDRSGLVAGYVGQTALKTQGKVSDALGGILFVDEAYALADGDGANYGFGREALDTLVKAMEDHRESLVVIFAGYSADMDRLLGVNPGLSSRFPNIIEFEDYSAEELIEIATQMLKARGMSASAAALFELRKACVDATGVSNSGNGRFVRNLIDAAVRRQSRRLVDVLNPSRAEMLLLEAEDIPKSGNGD